MIDETVGSVEQALDGIEDGAVVTVGGFGGVGRPTVRAKIDARLQPAG